MNRPHTNKGKVGLLVSVRDVNEARIANASGHVSIIDLKEPSNGSLGCINFETATQICAAMSKDAVKSIALGEVADGRHWMDIDRTESAKLLTQFQFAKAGLSRLAGQTDWEIKWGDYLRGLPPSIKRVAVAYADSDIAQSPSMMSIAESAKSVGCSALLVDTFGKGQGSVFDLVPMEELHRVIEVAKNQNLTVVLAGSLNEMHVAEVDELLPDFVAVRGAVCSGNRESTVCQEKINLIASRLKRCE